MKRIAQKSAAFVAVLLVVVFAFYIGTAVTSSTAQGDVTWPVVTPQPVSLDSSALASEQAYAKVYNEVGPSVVSINVVAQSSATNGFSNQGSLIQGTGTGFVIDTAGHIVTNNHVVDGAISVEVNFFDGSIYRGTVVGVDPDSDLAVIQVDRPANELHPVTLGNSDNLFIGEEVVAIGSPFNQPWTLTTGVISALDRTIDSLGQFQIGSVIQTDAAINPGNSGGPLVNMNGEVVGVNSQILSQSRSSSGIGFAIPSNLVKRVAPALINTGKVDYSYLGISGGDITLSTIESLKLPNNARGVVVSSVEPTGPAGKAGLQNATISTNSNGESVPTSADIITQIDGQPVTSMEALIAYLASNTKPGDTVNLTVVRNGTQELTLPVTLAPRPAGS